MCRIEIGENIEDNKRNLMMLTQKVFDAIVASSERLGCLLTHMGRGIQWSTVHASVEYKKKLLLLF